MEWGTCTILGYGRNEQVHHPLWISPDQGDAVEPLEWFRCLRASNADRTLGFHVGDYSSLVTCASVWTSVRTLGQGDSNERRRIQCPKSTSNLQIQRVSRVCEGISRNGNNSIQRLYILTRGFPVSATRLKRVGAYVVVVIAVVGQPAPRFGIC
jgi:hypothetical protein